MPWVDASCSPQKAARPQEISSNCPSSSCNRTEHIHIKKLNNGVANYASTSLHPNFKHPQILKLIKKHSIISDMDQCEYAPLICCGKNLVSITWSNAPWVLDNLRKWVASKFQITVSGGGSVSSSSVAYFSCELCIMDYYGGKGKLESCNPTVKTIPFQLGQWFKTLFGQVWPLLQAKRCSAHSKVDREFKIET